MSDEPQELWNKKGTLARGVSFVLVAIVAFIAGLALGGNGTAAAVVSQVPLVGSGLSASPDPNADLTDFWEAWNALQQNYVITHASTTLPTTQDKIYGAIEGLAASYGDPFTEFFPPQQAQAFNENISGSFAGVGMEIDVKNGVLTVVAPLKGTPAQQAGIQPGDQIIAINGSSTSGISTNEAVNEIRGPKGSMVDLTIIRSGKQLDVKITRETIQVPETKDSYDPTTGVYTIALYEFTSDSASLFDEAWTRFKASGAKYLVLDLRGNPGGYLDAAVSIASHFLPKGETIVTEDFGGKQPNEVHTSLGPDDLPAGTKVAVLVDGGSASASEILAGALKDHHVATLIGTQTFGKGSVQTLIPIDGGQLKVTVARWVTPSGQWIMEKGITPDIKVPIATSTPPFTPDTSADPQYERAVQFLTGR